MARKNKAKRTKIKQEAVPPAVNDNKPMNKPTPERTAHNDFRTVGMAMQLVPPIVRLHEQGLINDREFAALAYYRDQAGLADKSPVKSCLDWTPKGGHGPGIAIISAQRETWRLENNMGGLWAMCRAICVDDVTVEGWCLHKHGSAGPDSAEADPHDVEMAIMMLRYAAGGIIPQNS